MSDKRNDALSTLKNHDWTASEDRFKLAVAVIEHRYKDAAKLMRSIGTNGSIRQQDYASFPLFKEFCHTKEFMSAYKELFGKEFIMSKVEE